jgi:hypothetical protein
MTLYEIDKALMDFEFEVDEETGEILNASDLDELQMARHDKIENIGLYIKNLEAEKEAVKHEKDNFADREKRLGKKIESLKGYLGYALQGQKFSTPKVAVSFRKSESVLVKDEYLVPDKYCEFTMVRKPNKTNLKKALKDGEEIMGVELVEKQNVSVK